MKDLCRHFCNKSCFRHLGQAEEAERCHHGGFEARPGGEGEGGGDQGRLAGQGGLCGGGGGADGGG